MSKMTVLLAKVAGMNETRCELLLNAGPMHDIGKIGIPDKILGYLEKLEFSFKIKACEKFNRRHMSDISRIKFFA
jgi:response regulator RpfG family c-di-GMP phosphodiesterase